jgi:hypothetical protein
MRVRVRRLGLGLGLGLGYKLTIESTLKVTWENTPQTLHDIVEGDDVLLLILVRHGRWLRANG